MIRQYGIEFISSLEIYPELNKLILIKYNSYLCFSDDQGCSNFLRAFALCKLTSKPETIKMQILDMYEIMQNEDRLCDECLNLGKNNIGHIEIELGRENYFYWVPLL